MLPGYANSGDLPPWIAGRGSGGKCGGIAAGIFGYVNLGGLGGVSFLSQLVGSLLAVVYALVTGFIVYGVIVKVIGFRLDEEDEFRGSDLSIHNINSYPEDSVK